MNNEYTVYNTVYTYSLKNSPWLIQLFPQLAKTTYCLGIYVYYVFIPQPHYISQQPSIQLTTVQRFVKAVTAFYFFVHVKRVRYSSIAAWRDNGRDATCPACALNSWQPWKHKHHKDIITFEFYT